MSKRNGGIRLLGIFRDVDNTTKYVFQSFGGIIELNHIINKDRTDVWCVPTHHYCTLGCRFCHLTEERDGVTKKMDPIDVADIMRIFKFMFGKIHPQRNCLLSFMGVGEPFLNQTLITDTYQFMKKSDIYLNVGCALSTMMPTIEPMAYFKKMAVNGGLPLKIHFSLHSPIDKIRRDIIPASKIPLRKCLRTLSDYHRELSEEWAIMENLGLFHSYDDAAEIHYTVIEGVNDSEKELTEMIRIGNEFHIPLKLLKFNPTKYLSPSSQEAYWYKILRKRYGAPVVSYSPPGAGVGASCGQFTRHYYLGSRTPEDKKDFLAWKEKYEVN